MERLKAFLFIVCTPLIGQHYVVWCFKGNFIPDDEYGFSAVIAVGCIIFMSAIYREAK